MDFDYMDFDPEVFAGIWAAAMVFALATGIPVIITAWLIAYSVGSIGGFYNRIRSFEFWFRRVVAVLFIGVGIYYCLVIYLFR